MGGERGSWGNSALVVNGRIDAPAYHLVILLIRAGDIVQVVLEAGGLTNSAETTTHHAPADLWRRTISRGHSGGDVMVHALTTTTTTFRQL